MESMIARFIATLLLSLPLGLVAQTGNTMQPLVNREITMLEFVGGGSPLTAAERSQAANIVAMGMREAPNQWIATDKQMQTFIAVLGKQNPAILGIDRDASRYQYAFKVAVIPELAKEFDLENRIIDAHDPILARDSARKLIVTEHMLLVLRQASQWTANSFGVAPPSSLFLFVVRARVQQLATIEPDLANGLGHIERDQPFLNPYWSQVGQPARVKIFTNKQNLGAPAELSDPRSSQWALAQAAAQLSGYAAKHAGTSGMGSQALYSMYLMKTRGAVMSNAARGLSPACSPLLSPSARFGNHCTAPMPVPGLP